MIKSLASLFRNPRRVRVITRESNQLRISDWRGDQRLCAAGSKVLAQPEMQLMLSVLYNEQLSLVVLPFGTQLQDRAVAQARAEGYAMALSNLEGLGKFNEVLHRPEETFEPEEKE